jgi:hypothetical protein
MYFDPLRTDKQASKQTIFVCKTLLYEKENYRSECRFPSQYIFVIWNDFSILSISL